MPISFDEYKMLLKANISVLESLSSDAYPNLYHMLMQRDKALYSRLLAILHRMHTQGNQTQQDGYWFVFFSLRNMAEQHPEAGENHITWYRSIILFLCWGLLIRKFPPENSLNGYMRKAYELMQQQGRDMPTPYYSLPLYTPEQLTYADRQAERWLKSGATFTGFTKETVIEVYDQLLADSIYEDGRRKTKQNKTIEQMLVQAAKDQIKAHGYTKKHGVMQEVSGKLKMQLLEDESYLSSISELLDPSTEADVLSWQKVNHVFTNRGKLILQRANMTYAPPTKEQRQRYALSDGGWIITRKSTGKI